MQSRELINREPKSILKLDDFEEIAVDKEHSEIKLPMMHVELSFTIRYFLNRKGVGFCSLYISSVHGKGLRGKIEAAAAKVYVGRTILIFLSELENGKKLVTVPALFEKEPEFDKRIDLSGYIIHTYYHADFKKTREEVYKEHLDALIGKKTSNNPSSIHKSILELPKKGIEIMESYR